MGPVMLYEEKIAYLSKFQLMEKLNMDPNSAEGIAFWRRLVLNREAGLRM